MIVYVLCKNDLPEEVYATETEAGQALFKRRSAYGEHGRQWHVQPATLEGDVRHCRKHGGDPSQCLRCSDERVEQARRDTLVECADLCRGEADRAFAGNREAATPQEKTALRMAAAIRAKILPAQPVVMIVAMCSCGWLGSELDAVAGIGGDGHCPRCHMELPPVRTRWVPA